MGQEAVIDGRLELASVAETVTVRQEAPLVSTPKTSVDQIISREQIDNLPLSGVRPRRWRSSRLPWSRAAPQSSQKLIVTTPFGSQGNPARDNHNYPPQDTPNAIGSVRTAGAEVA